MATKNKSKKTKKPDNTSEEFNKHEKNYYEQEENFEEKIKENNEQKKKWAKLIKKFNEDILKTLPQFESTNERLIQYYEQSTDTFKESGNKYSSIGKTFKNNFEKSISNINDINISTKQLRGEIYKLNEHSKILDTLLKEQKISETEYDHLMAQIAAEKKIINNLTKQKNKLSSVLLRSLEGGTIEFGMGLLTGNNPLAMGVTRFFSTRLQDSIRFRRTTKIEKAKILRTYRDTLKKEQTKSEEYETEEKSEQPLNQRDTHNDENRVSSPHVKPETSTENRTIGRTPIGTVPDESLLNLTKKISDDIFHIRTVLERYFAEQSGAASESSLEAIKTKNILSSQQQNDKSLWDKKNNAGDGSHLLDTISDIGESIIAFKYLKDLFKGGGILRSVGGLAGKVGGLVSAGGAAVAAAAPAAAVTAGVGLAAYTAYEGYEAYTAKKQKDQSSENRIEFSKRTLSKLLFKYYRTKKLYDSLPKNDSNKEPLLKQLTILSNQISKVKISISSGEEGSLDQTTIDNIEKDVISIVEREQNNNKTISTVSNIETSITQNYENLEAPLSSSPTSSPTSTSTLTPPTTSPISSPTSTSTLTPPTTSQNRNKQIMDFFIKKGYSKEQAAGMIGSLQQESQLNPQAINKSSGAFGVAQWLGSRKQGLFEYAKQVGKDPTDLQTQLEYHEIEMKTTEKAAARAISSAGTPEEVAQLHRRLFERPGEHEANDSARIQYAQAAYRSYSENNINSQNQISNRTQIKSNQPQTNFIPSFDVNNLKFNNKTEAMSGGQTQQGTIGLANSLQNRISGFKAITAMDDAYHHSASYKARKSSHKPSTHELGTAIDYTINDPQKSEQAAEQTRQLLKEAGVKGNVINEYLNPSSASTGGHIHTNFDSVEEAQKYQAYLSGVNLNSSSPIGNGTLKPIEVASNSPKASDLVTNMDTNQNLKLQANSTPSAIAVNSAINSPNMSGSRGPKQSAGSRGAPRGNEPSVYAHNQSDFSGSSV